MGQGSLNEEKIIIPFYEKRREICYSCEHLKTIIGIKSCEECGCAIWSKTMVRSTKCPVGKWHAEEN